MWSWAPPGLHLPLRSSSRTDFAGGRPAVTVPREGLNGLGASGVWQAGGSPYPHISTRGAGKGGGNVLQFCLLEPLFWREPQAWQGGLSRCPRPSFRLLRCSREFSCRSFVLEMEKLRPWPGSAGAAERIPFCGSSPPPKAGCWNFTLPDASSQAWGGESEF